MSILEKKTTEELVEMKKTALASIEENSLIVQAINKELHPRNMKILAENKMKQFIKENTPKEDDVEEMVITPSDVATLKV